MPCLGFNGKKRKTVLYSCFLQLIDGKKSVQEITNTLNEKFPDAGDLSADVNEFISTAIEKKWLYYE